MSDKIPKVNGKYKNKALAFETTVLAVVKIRGATWVAFESHRDAVPSFLTLAKFLALYNEVPKYNRGDLLEFDNNGQKIRVLYLSDGRCIRVTPWDSTTSPSLGRIDYYLFDIDPNPTVLGNYDNFIANAYKEDNS